MRLDRNSSLEQRSPSESSQKDDGVRNPEPVVTSPHSSADLNYGIDLTVDRRPIPSLGIVMDGHFAGHHCGGPEDSCIFAVCVCPKEFVQPIVTLLLGRYRSSSSVSALAEATG